MMYVHLDLILKLNLKQLEIKKLKHYMTIENVALVWGYILSTVVSETLTSGSKDMNFFYGWLKWLAETIFNQLFHR